MQTRTLRPEQIIVPGEYQLGNKLILQIYFRVFDRGHGSDLPPVIVTTPAHFNYFDELDKRLKRDIASHHDWPNRNSTVNQNDINRAIAESQEQTRKDKAVYSGLIEKLGGYAKKQGDIYLLVDGNHKSAAATLTHKPIQALELETNDDIKEIKRMVKRQELFDFPRSENSLGELVNSFYEFCRDRLESVKTVKERINELTWNKGLPRHMLDRYLSRE